MRRQINQPINHLRLPSPQSIAKSDCRHPIDAERRGVWRQFSEGGGLRRGLHVGCCLLGLLASPLCIAQQPPGDDDLDGLLEGLDLQTEPEEASPRQPRDPRQNDPERALDPSGPVDRGREPPLAEAYRSMQTAQNLLAQGEIGEGTQAAQRRAIDLLDELIRAAEQQQNDSADASSQQPSADESSANAPQPSDAQGESGARADEQQPADGEEEADGSDPEGATPGEAGEGGEATARIAPAAGAGAAGRNAGQGVWGHLPERTRGMLRSEMPTEYLPQYAPQISEYFRRLSEMQPDE